MSVPAERALGERKVAPDYERFLHAKEQAEAALMAGDMARVLVLLDDDALLPSKFGQVFFAGWRRERLIELRGRCWQALLDSTVLDYRRLARAFQEGPAEVARAFHRPLVERESLRELAIATYQEIYALCYLPGHPAPRMCPSWSRLEEGYREFQTICWWSRRRVVEGFRLDLSRIARADWRAFAEELVARYVDDPNASDGTLLLGLVEAHRRPPAMTPDEADTDLTATVAHYLGGTIPVRDTTGFDLELELAEQALNRRKIRTIRRDKMTVEDERDGKPGFDERYLALVRATGQP